MKGFRSFLLIFLSLTIFFFLPIVFTAGSIAGNFGDVYQHYYPLRYFSAEYLIKGELPLWNPYIFAGQPLLANPQSALFYPLNVLFYILPLPSAFNIFIVLHFLLAGIFFYLLLSGLRFSRSAAFMGSVAFTYSSFLVYQVPAGHPAALSGFIWLPLIMLLLSRLAEDANSIAVVLLLGAACSFQFLSGHTFPFFISMVFIFIHSVYHKGQYVRRLSISFGIFIMLSALQLLPSLELSRLTETSNWPWLVKSYSLSLENLFTTLIPGIFGSVIKGSFVPQDSPSFFFEKYDLYFGLLPLLLSLAGTWNAIRECRYFFPILLVSGLFLAFGFSTPVYRMLYDWLPGLSYLRVPARFYLLCLISLIIMAAAAWDALLRRRKIGIKIFLLCLIIADLFIWGKQFIYAQNLSAYRSKNAFSEQLSPAYRIMTEPEFIASNKSMMYHHYNLNGYEAILLRDFTRYLGLQEKKVLSATGLARADLRSPLSRGFATGYYIGREQIPGTSRLADAGVMGLFKYDDPLPRIFVARQAKVIPQNEVFEQMNYLRGTPLSPDSEIVLPQLPPWFNGSSGRVKMLSYRTGTQRISAEMLVDRPAIIVFSEMYYPGWKACAGGKNYPLMRGNRVFRTLVLPAGSFAGRNAVRLIYDPVSWRLGLFTTVCSIILIALYLLCNKSKGASRNASSPSRSI